MHETSVTQDLLLHQRSSLNTGLVCKDISKGAQGLKTRVDLHVHNTRKGVVAIVPDNYLPKTPNVINILTLFAQLVLCEVT